MALGKMSHRSIFAVVFSSLLTAILSLSSCGKEAGSPAPRPPALKPKTADASATPAPTSNSDLEESPANASLSGLPDLASNQSRVEVSVTGEGISEYRFNLSRRDDGDCKGAKYLKWTEVAQPIIAELIEPGEHRLCVVGRNKKEKEQKSPSEYLWNYAPQQKGVTLLSIEVDPAEITIIQGLSTPLKAMGKFSDGTTAEFTASSTWSSPAENVVSVMSTTRPPGTAFGVDVGTVTVTAKFGEFISRAKVNVVAASLTAIAITPANPSIAAGTTTALSATGTYDNNTTANLTREVTWSTADSRVVGVTDGGTNTGIATGVIRGASNVSATIGTVRGMTRVTVTDAVLQSIQVTPAALTAVVGTTAQLTATGVFSDGSRQNITAAATTIWTSSNGAIASINNTGTTKGLISATAPGSATITVRSGNISGAASITVVAATLASIAVTPANATIFNGATLAFNAVGTFTNNTTQDVTATVTWVSSATAIATMSNVAATKGQATGLSAGSATISATLGSVSGSTGLTVSAVALTRISITPAAVSLVAGAQRQMVATGVYNNGTTADLTTNAQWLSSNTTLATVSTTAGNQGVVSAAAAGTSTITARVGTIAGTATVTVTAPPPAANPQ